MGGNEEGKDNHWALQFVQVVEELQIWASWARQAYLFRFNDKLDTYLAWGGALLSNSPTLEGMLCNMTIHAWQTCFSTDQLGMRGGDTDPPAPRLKLLTQAGHCPEPFSSSLELPW